MELTQFLAALLLYMSKRMLRRHNSHGWLPGIIGVVILQYIIWDIEGLEVVRMYNWGLIFLSSYGLLSDYGIIPRTTGVRLKMVLVAGTLILCVLEYYTATKETLFDKIQLLSTFLGLFGTVFLATRGRLLGFCLYFLAHFTVIYVFGFGPKAYWYIVFFQILSAYEAWMAIREEYAVWRGQMKQYLVEG